MFSINFSSALEVKRWFLALLLIMFNTHYLLVDFGLISITKLTVMALCPFLLLSFHKNISKKHNGNPYTQKRSQRKAILSLRTLCNQ